MQTWPLPHSLSAVQVRPGENLQTFDSHFSANGQDAELLHVAFDAQRPLTHLYPLQSLSYVQEL